MAVYIDNPRYSALKVFALVNQEFVPVRNFDQLDNTLIIPFNQVGLGTRVRFAGKVHKFEGIIAAIKQSVSIDGEEIFRFGFRRDGFSSNDLWWCNVDWIRIDEQEGFKILQSKASN